MKFFANEGVRMEVATICFSDIENGDEAVVVVRTIGEAVGLALSLKRDGDTEVFFRQPELDRLIEALKRALGQLASA